MIFDFDVDPGLLGTRRSRVCIAGAGVAGITLALALARKGTSVVLLEGGGKDFTAEAQDPYIGPNAGRDYFDLDVCRLRYLGGSSNHWNGQCRPLDAVDFEARDYIDWSGWPIRKEDLDPYLDEANRILELDAFPDSIDIAESAGRFQEAFFRRSTPVRFNETYHDELDANESIVVALNANLVDIRTDPDTGRIASFVVQGYGGEQTRSEVVADHYVLALGGIENARMLLASNKQIEAGVANSSGFVGRCFMEHPHADVGYCATTSTRELLGKDTVFYVPSHDFMRQSEIGNISIRLKFFEDQGTIRTIRDEIKEVLCLSDTVRDLAQTLYDFDCPRELPFREAGLLSAMWEQVPNLESRITLDNEVDGFGLRRAKLAWRMTDIDARTVQKMSMALATYFAEQDIGRIKLHDWVLAEDPSAAPLPEDKVGGGYHHMGTTRMAATPAHGVVDENCRAFDSDNLYIAGSSVFTTGGYANPTLSIVQLTLRLADHMASLDGA